LIVITQTCSTCCSSLQCVRRVADEGSARGALVGDRADRRKDADIGASSILQAPLDRVGFASLTGIDCRRIIDWGDKATEGVAAYSKNGTFELVKGWRTGPAQIHADTAIAVRLRADQRPVAPVPPQHLRIAVQVASLDGGLGEGAVMRSVDIEIRPVAGEGWYTGWVRVELGDDDRAAAAGADVGASGVPCAVRTSWP
jgi:hypothetical protein